MSKSGDETYKVSLFLMGAGGYLMYSGLRRFKRARQTQDAAAIPIASAPQGQVEVEGYAWPATPLPETAQYDPHVFQELRIEYYTRSGKNSSWRTVFTHRSASPFYIVDSSGMALVRPEGAELEMSEKTILWRDLEDRKSVV